MPDRTNTQKLLTLHVSETLFAAAERCRKGRPRSQWLREAIAEKLQREGIPVPDEAVLPPDRAGKGGPRPVEERLPAAAEEPKGRESAAKKAAKKQVTYPKPARKKAAE